MPAAKHTTVERTSATVTEIDVRSIVVRSAMGISVSQKTTIENS